MTLAERIHGAQTTARQVKDEIANAVEVQIPPKQTSTGYAVRRSKLVDGVLLASYYDAPAQLRLLADYARDKPTRSLDTIVNTLNCVADAGKSETFPGVFFNAQTREAVRRVLS
ncbi:hypothetical protein FACS1894208_00740 [Clostridia bacterium]|nr:hypothetical protein FACS1894208_00740 [Clostridia bacterium]